MKSKVKGNAALFITALLWGTGFIAQKFGNDMMPPMTFNAVRQLMAAIVLCPVLAISLKRSGYLSREHSSISEIKYRRYKALKGGIFCGILLLLGSVSQQLGLLTVSVGKCSFITVLYIVITPFFSVFLGNKIRRKTIICVVIAIVGFALLSLKGGLSGTTWGDWITLFGSICFAAQIVVINYYVDSHNDIIISVLQMVFCGVVGLIISVIVEQPSLQSIWNCMPVLLYSTFFPTAIGFTFQIVGQKYTDSTSAALIMSLESVFAAILGAIILSERMDVREIIGCATIFAAVIINQVNFGAPDRS